MDDPRRRQGQQAEDAAVRALTAAGITVLARNWRCPAGEIDIVAEDVAPDYASGRPDARWLVLVEVRSRRRSRGSARQSFTSRKLAKLQEVAAHYIQSTAWAGPWRIDAVAVQFDGEKIVDVEHIRHAVMG
ncbi:MAG: YraN family protein [Caldilineaceae bacterium]|nr:YraN family protein [Caldilineaceae bacterium]